LGSNSNFEAETAVALGVTERTVDAAVSRLRRKIERDPDAPELVRTAWGVGYRFTGANP